MLETPTTRQCIFSVGRLFGIAVAAVVAILPTLKWDIGAWTLSIVTFRAAYAAIQRRFFLLGFLVIVLMPLFPAV